MSCVTVVHKTGLDVKGEHMELCGVLNVYTYCQLKL